MKILLTLLLCATSALSQTVELHTARIECVEQPDGTRVCYREMANGSFEVVAITRPRGIKI